MPGKFFARKIFCKQKGKLLGAEDAVAAVAQARNDEFFVVELFIQGSAVNLYVRMRFGQGLHALWGSDDAHEFDVDSALFLEDLDRFHSGARRLRALGPAR